MFGRSGYRVLCISVAAALLAGCGVLRPSTTLRMAQDDLPPIAQEASRNTWKAPEAASEDLIYVADRVAEAVDVYSYPDRIKVGRLDDKEPVGECSDTTGNVWIAQGYDGIIEYSHGGTKPIRKLKSPDRGDLTSCSVDPNSGDLAVTSGGSLLYVYRHAAGPPIKYSSFGSNYASIGYCAYDDAGHLYVAGGVGADSLNDHAAIWELKERSGPLTRLKFHHTVSFPYSAGIFWDGQHMAWEDGKYARIFQFDKPVGGSAKIIGHTNLKVESYIGQAAIYGGTVIVPYQIERHGVAFFDYPSGGNRIGNIGGLREPVAVAFSAASQTSRRAVKANKKR